MRIKTILTDKEHLEETLNEIGYEEVLEILPCTEHETTLFMIILRAVKWIDLDEDE